jgi:hypothetical protein
MHSPSSVSPQPLIPPHPRLSNTVTMYLLTRPALLHAIIGFISAHYGGVERDAGVCSGSAGQEAAAAEVVEEWMRMCGGGGGGGDAAFYGGLEDHMRRRGFRVPLVKTLSAPAAACGACGAADVPSFNQHAAVAKARAMWSELSQVSESLY